MAPCRVLEFPFDDQPDDRVANPLLDNVPRGIGEPVGDRPYMASERLVASGRGAYVQGRSLLIDIDPKQQDSGA